MDKVYTASVPTVHILNPWSTCWSETDFHANMSISCFFSLHTKLIHHARPPSSHMNNTSAPDHKSFFWHIYVKYLKANYIHCICPSLLWSTDSFLSDYVFLFEYHEKLEMSLQGELNHIRWEHWNNTLLKSELKFDAGILYKGQYLTATYSVTHFTSTRWERNPERAPGKWYHLHFSIPFRWDEAIILHWFLILM